jgi:cardiolipin synthase
MLKESWISEKIYYNSETYFADLVASIRQASQSIELETYIFSCDKIGNLIVEELLSASQRGVKVRVIVDGFGAFFEISKLLSKFKDAQVQMRVFHPFLLSHFKNIKWFYPDFSLTVFSHMNRRLHRKVCVIDRQTLFFGSINITDNTDRETAARVTGTQVLCVIDAFEEIWSEKKMPQAHISSLIRLNRDRKIRKSNYLDLIAKMLNASNRVWISNAYFVAPPKILNAIMRARQKGLNVEILVPLRPDPRFMKLLTETYYRGLLRIGVRIFEYHKQFLHAKSLLIDDFVMIGSSNMNHRSVFQDLEIDVVLTSQDSLSSMEKQFLVDRSNSAEVTLENIKERPWLDNLFTWFLHSLRSWL